MMLFLGEWFCDRFKMKNDDNRMLVRMYLNLGSGLNWEMDFLFTTTLNRKEAMLTRYKV